MSDKAKVWSTLIVCVFGVAVMTVSRALDFQPLLPIGALITGIGILMSAAIILDSDPAQQSEADDE